MFIIFMQKMVLGNSGIEPPSPGPQRSEYDLTPLQDYYTIHFEKRRVI